jgi:hypothetical protein
MLTFNSQVVAQDLKSKILSDFFEQAGGKSNDGFKQVKNRAYSDPKQAKRKKKQPNDGI